MSVIERRNRPESIDVLIVDDEEDIRELLELSLLRMGLACDTAGSVAEARERLAQRRYRLCLTDMRLPDGDGLELVEFIQSQLPGLPVAVITAYGSIETAIRALKLGAFDFVTKPVELKALRELVSHALKLEPRIAPLVAGRSLIGHSPAFEQLRAQIEKLARRDVSFVRVRARHLETELNVLAHRQPGKQRVLLEDDTAFRAGLGDRHVIEPRLAG